MVEVGRASAKTCMMKSDQFLRVDCERINCAMCFQRVGEEKSLRCAKNNVGYEGQCVRCPTRFSYLGESSRTAYTRLKEHLGNYRAAAAAKLPALPPNEVGGAGCGKRKTDVKSWMWEHCRDCHGGVLGLEGGKNDYKFEVTGVFRKCLDRQIDEGLRITECESEGGTILNSKNEWFTPRIVEAVYRQQ